MLIFYFMCLLILLWYVVVDYFFRKTTYYKVTKNGFSKTLFDVGKYGEYLTYKKLRGYEKNGARFLFNVYLPKEKNETTEIDVLMIASGGLYVFESKNYSGWIFGDEKSRTWTQTLPSGRKARKEHFLNPIMQNKLHIKWLKSFLDNEEIPLYSIIVFSERCTFKKVNVLNETVKVVKRDMLAQTVNKLQCSAAAVLTQEQIDNIYEKLYPYSQVSEFEKERHIQQIYENRQQTEKKTVVEMQNRKADEGERDKKVCPKCGKTLILREARRGANKGSSFYGCEGFPNCRYIENIK